MNRRKIVLLGGDARMAWLALRLQEHGCEIKLAALEPPEEIRARLPEPEPVAEALRDAEMVVFPVPTYDGSGYLRIPARPEKYTWAECIRLLPRGALVFAGGITPEMKSTAAECGVETVDLLERPELAELSAIATAEGAVAIAMKELSATLFGASCMVIGYGRCGSALARRLGALGARVTATARRREQLARIYADGFAPWPTERLAEKIGGCEAVFNTVPAAVLDRKALGAVTKGTVIIDIASEPGGVERAAAAELSVPWIQALGLPGKVAPRTAGEQLEQVITGLLNEREDMI